MESKRTRAPLKTELKDDLIGSVPRFSETIKKTVRDRERKQNYD